MIGLREDYMDTNNINGYIICEESTNAVEFKVKGEDKSGFIVAEGILQEGGKVNRNKRKYLVEELARNLASARVRELVTTGNFKGEAGHPTDTSLARQSKVDPTLEQVWYKKLWMNGPYVMGHFTGTSNALGRSFNEDLKRGQLPSFSLRAVGSLINENGELIVNRMQMIAYDRVYFPSHDKAYTTRLITTESSENNGAIPIRQYSIDESSYFYQKENEINAIAEAGNVVEADNVDLCESISSEEIRNFLVESSKNTKTLLNNFDLLYESISVDPLLEQVKAKTKCNSTVVLPLEEAIQRELMAAIYYKY